MGKNISDVIVIGGGVIGLATAWQLSKLGASVKLFEKHKCGSGSTAASMGVLNPPNPMSQNPLQIIHRKSLKRFPEFATLLENESGIKINYQQCGAIEVFPSETQVIRAKDEIAFYQANAKSIANLPEIKLLSSKEVLEFEPDIHVMSFGALYTPSSAKVDVEPFIEALKQAALKSTRVEIFENTEITKIIIEDGKVRGVSTFDKTFSAAKVLVCTGVWTRPEVSEYASTLPVRGQAVLTKYAGLKHIIKWQKGYLVPYPDNQVALGGTTEKKAGFNETCNVEGLHSILERAKTVFPPIANATFVKTWAGLRPAPLDRRPTMGEIPNVKGLFVSTGHYKIGFSLTPFCSEIMANAILNNSKLEELIPFLPRRFNESEMER